ncbi:MAG: DUF4214 domain-containing protein [Rhodobacteraceae bacterium]|nr:DUF4214 domain-containing protein [Paracoccaceae bacterium]
MTQIIETTEADIRTSLTPEAVFEFGTSLTTVVGTLDANQLTFLTSPANANTLGLDTTILRSDIYRVPLADSVTYTVELAIEGAGGGTLDDFGFTISGDNGNSPAGQLLQTATWTNLALSSSSTTNYFTTSFTKGPHDNVYITVLADSTDIGTYTLSVTTNASTIGNDLLNGSSEVDDDFTGYRGDDAINGFGGNDIVRYLQTDDVYTLTLGSQIQVEDRTGTEGTDSLSNIETLAFNNTDFELFRFDDVANLSEEQFSSFTEMYIAYFNRAPDAAGLMFWANAFATGTSIESIAQLFADSPEAQALFPSDAPALSFVESVYQNVLGRASDQAGLDFWSSVLANGSVSRAQFVLEILRGARADAPADATQDFIAQQAADVQYLNNKIDIGIYFSAILGMSDVTNARDVMDLYDGSPISISNAKSAADADFADAQATDGSGEFLIQLVGVVDDPFSIV